MVVLITLVNFIAGKLFGKYFKNVATIMVSIIKLMLLVWCNGGLDNLIYFFNVCTVFTAVNAYVPVLPS